MKLLCVIRDRLAESIGPVMAFPAVPAAIRSFSDLALDPQTMIYRHPEDFDILKLAEIDERSGQLTICEPPELLLSGVQWAAAQKPQVPEQFSLLKEA